MIKLFQKSPWDDFEEEQEENIFTRKRKPQFNFDNFNFNFNGKIISLILLALAALWLASGAYKVEEGEQAIIIRFGKFNRSASPGLNYHIPMPFEKVIKEKVDQSRRVEIGYRSTGRARLGGAVSSRDVSSESLMLTGDENIIELNVDITWHIKDLSEYIFNIDNPQETVKAAAESAIREVIGNTPITSVLSNQKQAIATRVEKLIQGILDQYKSGVAVEQVKLLKAEPPKQVIAAYRDVQTAKADKEKLINEAEAYVNDIIPRARGNAARLLEQAEGYRAEIISKAEGNVARFDAIYTQYVQNKNVTKDRLYLEMIEDILEDATKIIMGNDNMLPHMSVSPHNLFEHK